MNLGISEAEGELLLILDSDDKLMKDAIGTIVKDWEIYSSNKRICGMSYNRRITNKKIKLKEMTDSMIISNHLEYRSNKGFLTDRVEVYRTDIKKYRTKNF